MVAALLLRDIFLLAFSLKLEFPWLWAAKYSIFIFIGFKFSKPGHPSGYWSLPWPRHRQIQRWSSWIWKQVSLWGQFKIKKLSMVSKAEHTLDTKQDSLSSPWAGGEFIIRELLEDIVQTVSPLVSLVDTVHAVGTQLLVTTLMTLWHCVTLLTHLRCACLADVTTAPRRL